MAPDNEPLIENDNVRDSGRGASCLLASTKPLTSWSRATKNLKASATARQPEPEAELAEGEPAEQSDDAPDEIYGEFIGGTAEEAGVDFSDMSDATPKVGSCWTTTTTSLSNAGFSRNMVDNYLSGLQYNAAAGRCAGAQQVMQIKTEFGGAEEYDRMIQWAAENLEAERDCWRLTARCFSDINQTALQLLASTPQYTASELASSRACWWSLLSAAKAASSSQRPR